ncbi:MAG: enoyl-CoA hydratase/isomerase family protein [Candidatus Aminicenantes bacterium]|nr:enoyl-CoA hydratase/isomerase family protein [Candidatus Aminicenantes bacterium]
MTQSSYENILFEIQGDKAFLCINRPPVNILDIATMEEINEVLVSLKGSTDVKVLVLTSTGDKAFSAGVDIADHTEDKAEQMLDTFHAIFRNLQDIDAVTVAACKGLTLGGGCEVAIFCDLIFAADNLKIGQPEIKLSVFPPVALLMLPRLIGLKHAAELLFTGKVITAEKAERIGLVNKVVPLESFTTELDRFIRPFSELSHVGIKYSKKGLALGLDTNFDEGLKKIEKLYMDSLMSTEDAKEGLKAFMEKRAPNWKNR